MDFQLKRPKNEWLLSKKVKRQGLKGANGLFQEKVGMGNLTDDDTISLFKGHIYFQANVWKNYTQKVANG